MIEFRPQNAGGSAAVTVIYFIWGLGGFAVSIFAALGAPILSGIFAVLLWIGGMLFFGILVLMSSATYRSTDALPVYVVDKPRGDGLDQDYRGIPYMKLESGNVVAEFADGKHTFKSWKKFIESVPD